MTGPAPKLSKKLYTTAVTPAGVVCGAAVAALAVLSSQLTYSPQSLQPPPLPEAAARPGFTRLAITQDDDAQAFARYVGALKIPTVSYLPDAKPEWSERFGDARGDGDPFLEMHAYLKDHFPLVHKSLRFETVNGRSLLYTWEADHGQVGCPGEPVTPALITAHLDVVHPGPLSQWSSPPFTAKFNNETGYVVSRGAVDDKVGVLALLEATERLLQEGFKPCRTYYYALGHDEEVGGREGAMKISEVLQKRGVKLAFMLDEGYVVTDRALKFIDGPFAIIGVAEKGNARVNLRYGAVLNRDTLVIRTSPVTSPETCRFTHHGGHGSAPGPISAVTAMAAVVHALATRPMAPKVTTLQREMFEYLAPEASSLLFRIALANTWLFEPFISRMMLANPNAAAIIRTSISPNVVAAGTGMNVIANAADVGLDCRIVSGQNIENVVDHLKDTIRQAVPNVEIRYRHLSSVMEYDKAASKTFDAWRKKDEDTSRRGGNSENPVLAEVFTFDDWMQPPSPVADTTSQPWFGILAGTLKRVFANQEMVGVDGRKKGGIRGVKIAPGLLFGNTDSRHYWNLTTNIYRFTPIFVPKEHVKSVHGIDEQIHKESYLNAVEFYHEFLRSVDDVNG